MKTIAAVLISASLLAHAPLAIAGERISPERVVVHAERAGPTINRDIFGQFAEHLGEGIYGGVWVGRDSKIPNIRGIRTDVVRALRDIKVPVVRWPGGCFADEYNWRDGIGPENQRVARVNANWGGVSEPNTFGTDEFMDFVEQIGSEAYVSLNVGSSTPAEAATWLEYMTADQRSAYGRLRAANGHKEPYRIKYVGLGNEAWACGGPMTAEAYVDRMKLFSRFSHNFNPAQTSPALSPPNPNAMQRIAVGPDRDEIEYTEAVMKAWTTRIPMMWGIEGLSLHSYTWGSFPMTLQASHFGEKEYAAVLKETLGMEALIAKHSAIMDRYDPEKKVSLVVDEWGAWLKPMEGTNPMFLRQANSLRDAILTSLNLNIFARHADRVRMTNIAQMVNVIQAMILTKGDKMLLTPTYYIYQMYVPFQDAQRIPISIDAGKYTFGSIILPQIDCIAARGKDGKIWLALTNLDPNNEARFTASLPGQAIKTAVGQTLTAERVNSGNTFEAPQTVRPKAVNWSASGDAIKVRLPPKSVTVVQLEP